jgi:hypothetical protein
MILATDTVASMFSPTFSVSTVRKAKCYISTEVLPVALVGWIERYSGSQDMD